MNRKSTSEYTDNIKPSIVVRSVFLYSVDSGLCWEGSEILLFVIIIFYSIFLAWYPSPPIPDLLKLTANFSVIIYIFSGLVFYPSVFELRECPGNEYRRVFVLPLPAFILSTRKGENLRTFCRKKDNRLLTFSTYLFVLLKPAYRNPGMLDYRIPARFLFFI